MSRYAAFVLLLASGIVFQGSHGTQVNVTDQEGKLCLFANLTVNFAVLYEVKADKNVTISFELPSNATTDGSKCDTKSSTLKLNFGDGHSWSVDFTLNGDVYQADSITFSYNLSDSRLFPNALSNETASVTVKPQITNVGVDTCYSCKSKDMIQDEVVNMTLSNVLIQAFVSNGSKSEKITSCSADVPTTSAPPTTHATSTTTAAPVTNTTSTALPPTTTPTPTLPTPTTGKYSIKTDNSTACLLANFGLRVGFKQGEKYQEMNLEPNGTKVTGSCGVNISELQVASNTMTIMFTFTNDTSKFRLHALNFTAKTSSGVEFSEANTNLSLWEAALGSSYMCNKEQNYTITNLLTLYTFNLQVQPFEVKKDVFSTAVECQADAESFLVPIAVGVALLVLILIVLLAYFIGRKRNMATGYESF
ncbi:LOW QUALITY PROTEIN: lysosome-associated membrane glycoprotein 2 [Lates calcarifer]|uniref:LOW QUALITY PROTEIN: lysosome-associated membrane glycoprotein 2 n=1 Tax=Lates calcarifer TaxID=8187 RepID=A0AAJ7VEK1_LATCA|nr:LOW QUALITY PROTEIN: lysosome-associated membrane glycoprotein 2 [Lates calcarifer]